MGYKNADEMLAAYRSFSDCFSEIPDEFDVHADYLIDGMSGSDFIGGYKAYRELLIRIQKDMCDKPDEYGLYKYDKKGLAKPVNIMNYPMLWLFVAISQSGKIMDDVLHVSGKDFAEFVGGKAIGSHTAVPKNIDRLVAKLSDFGITVKGYSTGSETDFSVSSDVPRLITAIKASTISQYCKKSLMSDYCSFNYRLYTIGAEKKIPIEMTHTFLCMPEKSKQIMLALMNELGKNGWKSYKKCRHHNISSGWLIFGPLELYYRSNGTFSLLIAPWTAHEHHDYLEALPDRYKDRWKDAMKCRGCRKGECRFMYIGELLGRNGVHCGGHKPHYPLEMEDIPTIIETSLVLAGKIENKLAYGKDINHAAHQRNQSI